MSFNEKTIENIARLSRLKLSQADKEKYVAELDGIISWVEQLQQVNVEGVAPLASVTEEKNVQRSDEVTTPDLQKELMANAPETSHGFYVVPKMVE